MFFQIIFIIIFLLFIIVIFYGKYKNSYTDHQNRKHVVMLGDSLTYRASWWELLKYNWVINMGVDSDTTWGFISRLDCVIARGPKICFVAGWVNDIKNGESNDVIIHNLTKIIDNLNQYKIVTVLTMVIFLAEKYPNSYIFNKGIKNLNFRIKELANHKDISYLDLNLKLSNDGYLSPSYSKFDGIHLNKKAYEVWAKEVHKTVSYYNIDL